MACRKGLEVMRMGLVVAVVLVVGVVPVVHSLRLVGWLSFVLWLLVGLLATWLVLLVVSGRVHV